MLLIALALAAMPEPIDPRQAQAVVDRLGAEIARRSDQARVVLQVDTAGVPSDCVIVAAADRPRAQRFCNELLRLRYHPAHDATGAPIIAVMDYTMTTTIFSGRPSQSAPPLVDFGVQVDHLPGAAASATADLIVETDSSGHVSHCEAKRSAGTAALDRLACTQVAAAAFTAGHDAAGRPVAALRHVSFGFGTAAVLQ